MRIGLLALLGEPIADREQAVAARREMRSPILEGAARALLPAAAVHRDEDGERSSALRQIEIALQRDAVVGRVGHCRTDVVLG